MRVQNNYKELFNLIKDLCVTKAPIWLTLMFILYLLYKISVGFNIYTLIGYSILPLIIIILFIIIAYSEKGFYPIIQNIDKTLLEAIIKSKLPVQQSLVSAVTK